MKLWSPASLPVNVVKTEIGGQKKENFLLLLLFKVQSHPWRRPGPMTNLIAYVYILPLCSGLYPGKISLKWLWESFEVKKEKQMAQNRKRGGDIQPQGIPWYCFDDKVIEGMCFAWVINIPSAYYKALLWFFYHSFSSLWFNL